MPIGSIIAALMKYTIAEDYLLMLKNVDDIEIYNGNTIRISFVDGNTKDVAINEDGIEVNWYGESWPHN